MEQHHREAGGKGFLYLAPRAHALSLMGDSKFKVSRGGGRHFSRDLDPRRAIQGSSEDEEESSEEETSSDEDEGPGSAAATLAPEMAAMNLKLGNTEAVHVDEPEMSRAERKAMKKAQAAKKVQQEESGSEESSEEEVQAAPARRAPAPAKGKAAEQSRKEKYVSTTEITSCPPQKVELIAAGKLQIRRRHRTVIRSCTRKASSRCCMYGRFSMLMLE